MEGERPANSCITAQQGWHCDMFLIMLKESESSKQQTLGVVINFDVTILKLNENMRDAQKDIRLRHAASELQMLLTLIRFLFCFSCRKILL